MTTALSDLIASVDGRLSNYVQFASFSGTGDGSTTTYKLDDAPIVASSESVVVNSVALTEDTTLPVTAGYYYLDDDTGWLKFGTAPTDGHTIAMSYRYKLWDDTMTTEEINDGTLTDFEFTTSSGWAGAGTASDPYRLVLDGTDYVVLPDLGVTEDKTFTLEALFKDAGSAGGSHWLVMEDNTSTAPAAGLGVAAGKLYCAMYEAAWTLYSVTSTTSVATGTRHGVMTCDGSFIRCYVDGKAEGTPVAPPAAAHTVSRTVLGRILATQTYAGSILAIRLYSDSIGASGTAQNFAAVMHPMGYQSMGMW